MKKVLTAKDIAELLGVCEKTSYSLIRKAITTVDTLPIAKARGFLVANTLIYT